MTFSESSCFLNRDYNIAETQPLLGSTHFKSLLETVLSCVLQYLDSFMLLTFKLIHDSIIYKSY